MGDLSHSHPLLDILGEYVSLFCRGSRRGFRDRCESRILVVGFKVR